MTVISVFTHCAQILGSSYHYSWVMPQAVHIWIWGYTATVILSLRWAEEKRTDSPGLIFRFMLISTSSTHFLRLLCLLLGRILISPNIRSTRDLIQDLTSGGCFHLLTHTTN